MHEIQGKKTVWATTLYSSLSFVWCFILNYSANVDFPRLNIIIFVSIVTNVAQKVW